MGALKGQCSSPHQPAPAEWLKGNLIGSGSFGMVHLALDTATGSLFIVKSARSKAGVMPLKNEASILANLDSPHIVKCFGGDVSSAEDSDPQCSHLFFEYMAGGSLSDVIHSYGGKLDEKLIRLYTREILLGLSYLHGNGIVHCDIKGRNVLVGESGAVKLADFGCAKRLNSINKSTKQCSGIELGLGGTPLWMAPEVLRNEGLDFAADIWSLGCTVIEMATGRPPWTGQETNPTAAILNSARGNGVPEFPKQLSPEGLDFLSKCLQRDPQKRWMSEELLHHPFVVGKMTYPSKRREECVTSPASVLYTTIYDSSNDDDEEFGSITSVPFSVKFCLLGSDDHVWESDSETSDYNWITVRSSNEHK